jgi:hypothetical protein
MHQQQQPVSAAEATWAFARDVNDAAARVRVLQVLRRPGGDQVSSLCYLLLPATATAQLALLLPATDHLGLRAMSFLQQCICS